MNKFKKPLVIVLDVKLDYVKNPKGSNYWRNRYSLCVFFPEHASWCFYSAVTPPRMFPAKGSSDEVSALAFVNFSREKGVFQSLKTFFVFAILTITTSWAQCMDSDSQRVVGGYSLCGRCWDNRLHAHTWGVCISYGRNSFWNVALRQVMNLSFLDI